MECAGIGLHSGAPVRMRILPAAAGRGIVFRRTDLDDYEIEAVSRPVSTEPQVKRRKYEQYCECRGDDAAQHHDCDGRNDFEPGNIAENRLSPLGPQFM